MKTLIVEDSHLFAQRLKSLLNPFGPCGIAYSGSEAIEKYSKAMSIEQPYELICLDLLLPVMDGFKVLQTIRKFEQENIDNNCFKSKIIIISSFNDTHMISKAKELGCDSYITKPFSNQKILNEISSLNILEVDVRNYDLRIKLLR